MLTDDEDSSDDDTRPSETVGAGLYGTLRGGRISKRELQCRAEIFSNFIKTDNHDLFKLGKHNRVSGYISENTSRKSSQLPS